MIYKRREMKVPSPIDGKSTAQLAHSKVNFFWICCYLWPSM